MSWKRVLVWLGLGAFSVACATAPEVPEPKAVPLTLVSGNVLNPHADGGSQSVDILLLYLESPHKFENVSLPAIYPGLNKPAAELGSDLVDTQLVRMAPNEERTMNLSLEPRVRYVGVVAAFEQFQGAQWRDLVLLRDESTLDRVLFKNKTLLIRVENLEVVASLEG